MITPNIQSIIYNFFYTNKISQIMQYWECDSTTLGLLESNPIPQEIDTTISQDKQSYKNLIDMWEKTRESYKQHLKHQDSTTQTSLTTIQDFFQCCTFHETSICDNTKNQDSLNQSMQFPKIIICSSDELALCGNALSFVETLHTHIHNTDSHIIESSITESKLPIILPDIRLSPYDSTQVFYEEFCELFAKLTQWYENNCTQTLITPPHTLMAFLPNKDLLCSFILTLHEHISIHDVIEKLIYYGYESVEIVEMQGEFSHRGDIIDIFIANSENPIRLSFFDTEIESIRYFSTETQLSQKEELETVRINPAMFSLNPKQYDFLESCIANIAHDTLEKSIHSLGFWFLKDIGGINFLETYPHIFTLEGLKEYTENLAFVMPEILPHNNQKFRIFAMPKDSQSKDMEYIKTANLLPTIKLNKNKNIYLLSHTKATIKSLDLDSTHFKRIIITPFYCNIALPDALFISLQKIQHKTKKHIKLELDSLKVGEFVVHSEYGIGIFECIKQVSIMGGLKDFISIVYANDDRLLLPVENLNLIERYSAYDSHVKLDKLGKSGFLKLKDSIKEKLLEIANQIIKVQAQRELSKGAIIRLDSPKQLIAYQQFEEKRGFELTKDQNNAITESLKDLKSGIVMDRLLNGDVGFGKTEVAMSLCYAAALNGFVSIVLVPTTLLCHQHFESFKERLEGLSLPNDTTLHIAKIDRFTTTKQKAFLESALQDNKVHIVIGTHAIFNLTLSNLGLIVIDEEHKFGVKQKEILKQKSLTTHVLSMSATPIPRTLNMAYSKLKAISELKTPPFFKQESKTFVKIKKDSLIKEVITRELRRGGQVFYIYNNIAKIIHIKKYLLTLLPHLRIVILHSQINPKETQQSMLDFFHRKYDVLLCTSIVESGIHLPNANTIIIDEAHNFGIADLHQLRGRVGRGKTVGFCYLLTKENINEEAAKRLLALEKNSYLGSGASLAYHDLEIRGGGNLLGSAQSGHIKQVGFGMYVRLLEETLQELLQSGTKENKIDLKLSVSAFLNDSLITSERMRLELYRRLSSVTSEQEVHEIEGEIEQRFGRLDTYSLQFLEIIIIKVLATKLHIKAISNAANNISITFSDGTRAYIKAPTKDDDDILLSIKSHLKTLLKAQIS